MNDFCFDFPTYLSGQKMQRENKTKKTVGISFCSKSNDLLLVFFSVNLTKCCLVCSVRNVEVEINDTKNLKWKERDTNKQLLLTFEKIFFWMMMWAEKKIYGVNQDRRVPIIYGFMNQFMFFSQIYPQRIPLPSMTRHMS